MRTLLLCGYRTSDHNEDLLGTERDAAGVTLLDRRIEQLQALGHDVIIVLAGASADEQLVHCRRIETVEMAFDNSANGGSLLSNTYAGAELFDNESCFVIPLEVVPPPAAHWRFLYNELAKIGFATPVAALQAVSPQGAPCHYGFPLLLTRSGNSLLKETADLKSLVDARLKYLHVEFHPEAVLEPLENPL